MAESQDNQDNQLNLEPDDQSIIPVEDPRPWASERNNITTNLNRDTIQAVMDEAQRYHVDPITMAAIAWKESLGGQRGVADGKISGQVGVDFSKEDLARERRNVGYFNPLQANTQYQGPAEKAYQETAQYLASTDPGDENEKFQNAQDYANLQMIRRRQNIRNAMEKMSENMALYPDDEEKQIAAFNGTGPRARHYGREVTILKDYLAKHPRILRMLEGS